MGGAEEGESTSEHAKHHDTNSPHVRPSVNRFCSNLLGRHVGQDVCEGLVQALGQPDAQDLDLAIAHEGGAGADVAMHQVVLAVDRVEDEQEVRHSLEDEALRNVFSSCLSGKQHVLQGLSRDVLCDEVALVIPFSKPQDSRPSLVSNCRSSLRFLSPEPLNICARQQGLLHYRDSGIVRKISSCPYRRSPRPRDTAYDLEPAIDPRPNPPPKALRLIHR
mmetsp:Transcript_31080/g.99735  ORF Transcript_31080/g.99735 Transcript_31080/m.99735 type:complete len:220 (+) Transcript_31080:3461-4120(+)